MPSQTSSKERRYTQRRYEDGSRVWNDCSPAPRNASGKEQFSSRAAREQGLADTLILSFGLQKCEKKCSFKPPKLR